MISLTIVIVNWNAGNQLLDCVSSIAQHHSSLISKVVIVDNASIDDSLMQVESLQNLPFELRIIRNSDNRGFGAACNQGAAQATSSFLLFLNPDTRLFADSLAVPLNYLNQEARHEVGIVGIQLIDESYSVARSCSRFPTLTAFAAAAIGLDKAFPRLGHFMAEWDHESTREVDHVIGAFFMVRREVFEKLSGFDEQFFVYLEDLDFSIRASQAGWRTVYLADVRAFHAGGGTSRQVKALRMFYSLRSRLLYGFKHFGVFRASVLVLLTLSIEWLARSIFSLANTGREGLKNTWRAYGMLWAVLPDILQRVRG